MQHTIDKAKQETDYEFLMKMGEANEIVQALGRATTYRAYKGADDTLRCQVFEGKDFIEYWDQKEFMRQFNKLKRQFYKEKNIKIYDVLNQKKKGTGHFYFSS
mmetsp:Transcript_12234/g.10537  ORF Transcript_12234/g.10537 Transcript_12234/m.10537 type:complete len:103 (-) Transcript_12234:236-544(-)